MRIAANGVWGNLGVASAALVTGFLIDHGGWRMAFILPGLFSIGVGLAYFGLRRGTIHHNRTETGKPADAAPASASADYRRQLIRVSAIVFLTTAVSSITFQSTTFALPKIFDERLQGFTADLVVLLNGDNLFEQTDVATVVGSLAFIVFAVASLAQLVVGSLLDRFGPRRVLMGVAILQLVFFALMPGLTDIAALCVALGFMLGGFGQIPINDYMIGKMASGTYRARIYGVRYVIAFTVLALSLPLIAFVYDNWGFDTLFRILVFVGLIILLAAALLPRRLPTPETTTQSAAAPAE